MSAINTGELAFPHGYPTHGGEPGMTLRDHFAGLAMPMAMARLKENYDKELGSSWYWDNEDWDMIAEIAYEMADEMLKARAP